MRRADYKCKQLCPQLSVCGVATINFHFINYIYRNEKYLKKVQLQRACAALLTIMKSTKVPSAEFGGIIGIFGLKTPFHAYVL